MANSDKTHLDLELGQRHSSATGEDSGVSRSAEVESGSEIVKVSEKKKKSETVEGSSVELDLESGVGRNDGVSSTMVERDCRICHLSLEFADQNESDAAIMLGCSCKEDLAAAHKQCAEAWFKIKGNKTCEICGTLASNVTGPNEPESLEHWSESNDVTPPPQPAPHPTETQNFWQGHRFLNFLLACMVFAFVISWLFHFNIRLKET